MYAPDTGSSQPSTIQAIGPPLSDGGSISVRLVCLILLLFFLVSFGVHHAGFHSPMVYDSWSWIEGKAHVFARHNPIEVIGIAPSRPLFMLSLYLNYLAAGMDPYYFRTVNSAIVAAAALVLALLSFLILDMPGLSVPGSRFNKLTLSFFLGLLFVVHPLQSLVVLYIWQREAIMACFFYFSSLAAYFAARTGPFGSTPAAYALTGLLFFAGMLSKENVATLPVVLVLAELTLFRQSLWQVARRTAVVAGITVPPILAYLALVWDLHGADSVVPRGFVQRLYGQYARSGLSPFEVLLTESRVVFLYLSSVAAPFVQGAQLIRAEVISRTLWNPPITVAACAGVVALIGLAIGLVRKSPVAAFSILFFFVTLAPESILIPQYLFFGYRAILPMAGVLWIFGVALLKLDEWACATQRMRFARALVATGLVVVVIGFGLITVSQSRQWNPLQFWQGAYSRLPPFSRDVEKIPYMDVVLSYGIELTDAGKFDDAIDVLSRADQKGSSSLAPIDRVKIFLSLGDALQKSGKLVEAVGQYKKAADLVPGYSPGHVKLGLAMEEAGSPADAINEYRKAIEIDPRNAMAHNNLGLLLDQGGDVQAGMEHYRKAIEADPMYSLAHSNLGLALKKVGDLKGATLQLRKAIDSDPNNSTAYTNLALTMEELGQVRAALEYHTKAVQLNPSSVDANYALANALVKSGSPRQSIAYYRKALELTPDFPEADANLGMALLAIGKPSEAIECLQKALTVLNQDPELYYALGQAFHLVGDNGAAAESLRRTLALNPSHGAARRDLETLTKEKAKSMGPLPH